MIGHLGWFSTTRTENLRQKLGKQETALEVYRMLRFLALGKLEKCDIFPENLEQCWDFSDIHQQDV